MLFFFTRKIYKKRKQRETCQNELLALGGLWTYDHTAFNQNGSETINSDSAEGKKDALVSFQFIVKVD